MKAKVKKGINLLPREYILEEKFRVYRTIGIAVLAAEILIFVIAFAIPPKNEISRLNDEIDTLTVELSDERFKDVNKTLSELEATKTELDAWMVQYQDLKQEDFVSARELDTLTARLPLGVNVNVIDMTPLVREGTNVEPEKIVIEGTSYRLIDVATYVANLENTYGSGSTTFESSYDDSIGAQMFTIDISLPIPQKIQDEIDAEKAAQEAAAEASEGSDE